eukprot:3935377-Prymnesium_polylepis.1
MKLGIRAAFLSRGYSSRSLNKGQFHIRLYRTPHFVVTVHLVLPPFTFSRRNAHAEKRAGDTRVTPLLHRYQRPIVTRKRVQARRKGPSMRCCIHAP